MAVVIRMKRMGRTHRAFFRICAADRKSPRDGRVIEELGTYDPSVPETDARCALKGDRVAYWLSVGAAFAEGQRSDQEVRHQRHSPEADGRCPCSLGDAEAGSRSW